MFGRKDILLVQICLLLYSSLQSSVFSQNLTSTISLINSTCLKDNLITLASVPRLAGTLNDYESAVWVAQKYQEYGLENVQILNFTVLLEKPIQRSLELLSPTYQAISLSEYEMLDEYSNVTGIFPTWLAWSKSGNVTGQLIYANYGRREDFENLLANNVPITNSIALIRYGRIMRGTKLQLAKQFGAIGAILYSDPYEDGYRLGDAYPDGPWRSPSSVQRGSLLNLAKCPGSPHEERVERMCNVSLEEVVAAIPAVPISYGAAEILLRSMQGSGPVPVDWQGALPFHYHYGPGNVTVRLQIFGERDFSTCWNVVGDIPGTTQKEQIVGFGNHRDAWVFGASDPFSGSTLHLEVIRVLGLARAKGWSPVRTLRFYSWDAEEWGLMGSVDYGEVFAQSLSEQMVIYVNTDYSISDPDPILSTQATGSAIEFLQQEVMPNLPPLNPKVTSKVFPVSTLGSGSDYTVFTHHLGIPSINAALVPRTTPAGDKGNYHSKFDDIPRLLLVDPELTYIKWMTQFHLRILWGFASEEIVPFRFNGYVDRLNGYIESTQTDINSAGYNYRDYNWEGIVAAVSSLKEAVEEVNRQIEQATTETLADLNKRLTFMEREFLFPSGLPNRPWFRHSLQAPSILDAYGYVPFPGIYDAVALRTPSNIQSQIDLLAQKIHNASDYLQGGSRPPSSSLPISITLIVLIALVGSAIVFGGGGYFAWRTHKKSSYDYPAGTGREKSPLVL